jgi:hypothetical protein
MARARGLGFILSFEGVPAPLRRCANTECRAPLRRRTPPRWLDQERRRASLVYGESI